MAKGVGKLAGKVIKEAGEEVGKRGHRVINSNEVISGVMRNLGEDFDLSANDIKNDIKRFFKETGDFTLGRNGAKRVGFTGENLEDVISSRADRLRKVIDDNNIMDSDGLKSYIKNMSPAESVASGAKSNVVEEAIKGAGSSASNMKMPEGDHVYEKASSRKSNLKGSKVDNSNYIAPGSRELASNRYDSKVAYMQNKRSLEHERILKDFSEGKFDSDLLKQYEITKDTSKSKVEAMRNQMIKTASADDMGFSDIMGYNKIPEKVTGTVGTFWLVNKLSGSRGEQTNAQLYNQSPY